MLWKSFIRRTALLRTATSITVGNLTTRTASSCLLGRRNMIGIERLGDKCIRRYLPVVNYTYRWEKAIRRSCDKEDNVEYLLEMNLNNSASVGYRSQTTWFCSFTSCSFLVHIPSKITLARKHGKRMKLTACLVQRISINWLDLANIRWHEAPPSTTNEIYFLW